MKRFEHKVFAMVTLSLGLLVVSPVQAASVTEVNRSTWGATGVPSYVTMYIYVPDQLAMTPPIVVACHSCGTAVSGYINSISNIQAAADQNGFVLILPEATGRNCWDVGSMKSLTHDGGGDTQAVAQMVKYALMQYDGDASRVYIMGGSSGGMMTQAMMAVYPEIFKAGSARAGVPAGCWADGYQDSNQWSNNCAGGNTVKTAQQWGDLVRAMNPAYSGPRRRMQLFQGTNDTTISYKNMAESIKEWTNVLGLSETPDSTDMTTTSAATYRRDFWQNECGYTVLEAWHGQNGTHSMPYEEAAILSFFGLDTAGGTDPEPDCSGGGGMGGMGGMGGEANTAGAGQGGVGGNAGGSGPLAGAGGTPAGGGNVGVGGSTTGTGGMVSSGGSGTGGTPSGGNPGTGGMMASTGGVAASTGGTPSATGGVPSGGTVGVSSGGTSSAGTAVTSSGASSVASPSSESSGCSYVIADGRSRNGYAAVGMGLALLAFRRRRRRAGR